MSWAAVAIGGATILANMYGSQQNAAAQSRANSQNMAMTQAGIDENARQFDLGYDEDVRRFGLGREDASFQDSIQEQRNRSINQYSQEQYQPYQQTGKAALDEYQAFLGLSGADAAAKAQARFNETPGQKFLRERQEKSLLRNASATGGLRSGRTQSALQEQAAGIAAAQQDSYLDRLYGLSGQGLDASRGAVGAYRGQSDNAANRHTQVREENQADMDRRAEEEGPITGDFTSRIGNILGGLSSRFGGLSSSERRNERYGGERHDREQRNRDREQRNRERQDRERTNPTRYT